MIGKIVIAGAVWAALQFTAADAAIDTGGRVMAQAGQVERLKQGRRCAQARAFGIEELKRRGLIIDCD